MSERLEQGYARLLLEEIEHLRSKNDRNEQIEDWLDLVSAIHYRMKQTGKFPFTVQEVAKVTGAIVRDQLTGHGLVEGFEQTEVELLLLSLNRDYAKKILLLLFDGKSIQLPGKEE